MERQDKKGKGDKEVIVMRCINLVLIWCSLVIISQFIMVSYVYNETKLYCDGAKIYQRRSRIAQYRPTSSFMVGKVAVAAFIITWYEGQKVEYSADEINNIRNAILNSFMFWRKHAPSSIELNFYLVPGYDPKVVNTPDELPKDDYQFVLQLIEQTSSDWGFLIYINKASPYRSFAYFGGPSAFILGSSVFNSLVYAHEIGHIFWATDEYNGRTEGSDGYLDWDGANCIMNNLADNVCWDELWNYGEGRGTRGQIGWKDKNQNGIIDIFELPPIIIQDVTRGKLIAITNYAGTELYGAPWIKRIENIVYSFDGLNWNNCTAADGSFDSNYEEIQPINLSPGSSVYMIAKDNYGKRSSTQIIMSPVRVIQLPGQSSIEPPIEPPPIEPPLIGRLIGFSFPIFPNNKRRDKRQYNLDNIQYINFYDTEHILVIQSNGTVRIYNINNGTEKYYNLSEFPAISAVDFNSLNSLLIVGFGQKIGLYRINLDSISLLKLIQLRDNIKSIDSIAISPSGNLVALLANSTLIQIWQIFDGILRTEFQVEAAVMLSFLSNTQIAVGQWNNVRVFTIDGIFEKSIESKIYNGGYIYMDITNNQGKNMIAMTQGGIFSLQDIDTRELIFKSYMIHDDAIWNSTKGYCKFSPGAKLLAISDHRAINIWNFSEGIPARDFGRPVSILITGPFSKIAFSPDNTKFVASSDNFLYIFNLPNMQKCNIAPQVPILISPSQNAITSSLPVFKLKSYDSDNDLINIIVEVANNTGELVSIIWTTGIKSGEEISIISPKTLSPGHYLWRAKASDGIDESKYTSWNTFVVGNLYANLKKGLSLISIPADANYNFMEILGDNSAKIATWDALNRKYQLVDLLSKPQLNYGYWIYSDKELQLKVFSFNLNEQVNIRLYTSGWHIIGYPYTESSLWNIDSIRVRCRGEEKSLKEAQQLGWIEDYAWGWEQDANNPNTGRYVLVYDTSIIPGVKGQLEPWKGYWVYAHTDCELILPPPSQGKGRGTRGEGRVAKGNGWSMRLQASVDGSVGEAVIGIANGTRGLAVGLPPEPPTGNNGVQVILLKNNTPLAVDVRSDGARRQEWEVLVRFGTRDGGRGTSERKEVVLTFDGIGYAPKDVSAWLVDTVTGKRIYLRTQPSYRFAPEVGETERRFKVIVESGNERPLRIVGLKATPMRGEGLVITFALTKPAQVVGEVLTLTGRKIAVMDDGSTRAAGMNRMIWRGVGSDGAKVPFGAYLVRLVATDEDGRQVQAVTVVRGR
jgi:hypothetical protein